MVSHRRGASTLGCLFSMLVVVAVIYFAVNVGAPYFRYYQFRDAMRQEVRFAERKTDAEIRATLRLKADSLDLPGQAQRINIRRTPSRIVIWTDYTETIDFPFVTRDIAFRPVAERAF
ncbi:MAG TPA: hypothetical protein VJ650_16220 [Gemmatimonadaceae bacterium]|nr:hypothetical protein [Gemmatimonadaceae bacterium]